MIQTSTKLDVVIGDLYTIKNLVGTAAIRAAKISEAYDSGTEDKVNTPGFGVTLKDLPKSIWYGLTFRNDI